MTFQDRPISILAGVNPEPDSTELATRHYTNSDKIRFYLGLPQKIGGWDDFTLDAGGVIGGCVRNMYSQRVVNTLWLLIGSHTALYGLIGTSLFNITPLVTTGTTLGTDPLQSDFNTLGSNPIDTVISTTALTINQTAHLYIAGDSVTLAGSGAVNGVPAIEINKDQIVRTVPDANSFTITVLTSATSTGSGGGASVITASGIITVTDTAHGLGNGERIKFESATAFAGIGAAAINAEHIIRNAQTNTYDIVVGTVATSSAAGGGVSVDRFEQIADGFCDASFGRGYGVGKYGIGLYGVSKTSTNLLGLPRIWSFHAFGNNVILNAGGGTAVYRWTGDTATAPEVLANSPAAVNYVFVDNNIVVTLGADGVNNRIKWSDQGLDTVWTATPQNQAGEDDIEGAGKFISHAKGRANVLLFTAKKVYTFRYIGLPLIWEVKEISDSDGLIARNARISIGGTVYWMGDNNFHIYTGSRVQEIPSTIRRFVFTDINTTQQSKCFCWHNERFSEIWWHYPSASSNECDKYIIYNYNERTWAIGNLDRTAAEYPTELSDFHPAIDSSNMIHRHENGEDDGSLPLAWTLSTNFLSGGTNQLSIGGVIPDSIQTGNISLTVITKEFPQSTGNKSISTVVGTITPTTERLGFLASGKQRQYVLSGSELGQFWRGGAWFEEIEGAPPQ